MKKLEKILEIIGGVLVALLFFDILYQVIARVVLGVASSWTVELGRALFVAITFVGSAVLVYKKGHMVITSVYEKFSGVPKKTLDIINFVIILFGLTALAWGSYERTVENWNIVIPTLEWMTTGYVYLIILVGTLLMIMYTIYNMIVNFRRK